MNTFIERARPPATRKQAKEATRARVLEAARAQLDALGFEATSIRGVAKASGVATGTVLLHFADKRDLLHAALFEDLERTWAEARRRSGGRTLRRDLVALAEAFFAYYAARPALSRALLRESLFAEPPWRERFAAQVAEVHRHVAALAQAAKERGEIGASVDEQVLGATFFALYYFALLAWLQGGHVAPARLFARMLDQHLAGLAPPRGKTSTPRARARSRSR